MMAPTLVSMFLGLTAFILQEDTAAATDPCSSYTNLNDYTRSVFSKVGLYHDHLSGWYRFTGRSGEKMLDYEPKSSSSVYRCGADTQGYLSGKHPRGSEGIVDRTVCFTYAGNKCWTSETIKVKNCGSYFVYKLHSPSTRFFLRPLAFRYCGSGESDNLANPCIGYKQLTDASRSIRKVAHTYTNDYNINGWHRFTGDAGNKIADQEVRWTMSRCSAYSQGWMDGTHPKVSDGKVLRTVCFAYGSYNCWRSTTIKVQNCGGFYVYLLGLLNDCQQGHYMRYCGDGETEDKLENPCQGYANLSDTARSIRSIASSYTNDHSIDGWYRFTGGAGETLVEYEARWQRNVYRCQSASHSWLNGKHPKVSDGKVYRIVCFAYQGDGCWQSTQIKIKNCGNFYVYLLNGLYFYRYSGYIRYCGVGETPDTLTNPCKGYKTVSDASRSILTSSPSFTNDHSISGWYRFVGKAGNKIVDYDPQWKPGIYRCKSSAYGWLDGDHPRGSQGKVNRTVCFSYDGDTCWHSTKIKIRNCGDFFVYLLNNLYHYRYSDYMRFCGAGETENNYPCQHYQLLTERTRIASYRSKTNDFCDRNMDKWYRFWGEAGHRMLDKCPITDDRKVFPCGSYYHGWLNTTNPVPLDGNVNRSMCFSDVTTCTCKASITRQIQMRNCGSFFVYQLYGLNDICSGRLANNARYCGRRDKDAYQVTCSPNYMRIDLDRRYYNSSKFESITLLSKRCRSTLSYDYITLGCVPGGCSSYLKATSTEIVYINAVVLKSHFDGDLISRQNDETIYFKCSYKKDTAISNGASFKPVGEIAVNLTNFGNFSFHFNTYKTNAFEVPVKSFPIKLKLRDWLFFEVNATVEDSSLSLLIERCYSTPTMDPDEMGQYDLIKERCVSDVATSFVPARKLRRRFTTQVFRYKNSSSVYIHCLVFLCRKDSKYERCTSGCPGNKIRSRKRRDSPTLTDDGSVAYTGFLKLDSGRILLEDDSNPSIKEKGGSDKGLPTNTILIGGIAAIVVLLVVIALLLLRRRKESSSTKSEASKEIGLENRGKDMEGGDEAKRNEQSI